MEIFFKKNQNGVISKKNQNWAFLKKPELGYFKKKTRIGLLIIIHSDVEPNNKTTKGWRT